MSAGDLVRAAAAGDRAGWDELVARYDRMVWAIVRSYRFSSDDAGDVVQTVWLRLVERLDQIEDPERLGGWLATIARNESLRALKQRSRAAPVDPLDFPEEHVFVDFAGRLVAEERDSALWRAFVRLPERCQALLRLVVTEGVDYDEISAALGMPIGSIGPTRARCLDKLRRHAVKEGLNDETLRETGREG